MTKISRQFQNSGQFQDNFEISGISGISWQLGPLRFWRGQKCRRTFGQHDVWSPSTKLSSSLACSRCVTLSCCLHVMNGPPRRPWKNTTSAFIGKLKQQITCSEINRNWASKRDLKKIWTAGYQYSWRKMEQQQEQSWRWKRVYGG